MKKSISPVDARAINNDASLEDPDDWESISAFVSKRPHYKSENAIRHEIFMAEPRKNHQGQSVPGNGLKECGALMKVGNRVFISPSRYFAFWRAKSQQADSQPDQQPDQQSSEQLELDLTVEG